MLRTSKHALWLWLGLLATPALSQSIVKQADRQFDMLAYSKAADLYEQALQTNTVVSKADVRAARAKLAYSYRQVRDTQSAERVYRELIADGDLPTEYAQCYLYYAQALASNGKYREAQEAYEKYNAVQKDDSRGPTFSKLYRDVSVLSRNAGSYKVDFLNVNTNKAEFSPMLYKDGFVFVSTQGNDNKLLKRVFNWNETPFLDLYYMPERKSVKAVKTASVGGTKATAQTTRTNQGTRALGRDEYTPPTSNDSRTVGHFGGINVNEGLGYEDKPITESARFSQSLNTKYHEGPATFSKDGTRVIFTRNNYTDGKYRESSDGVNKLKLYAAEQKNGVWAEAKELVFNSNEYSTGHPSLGPGANGEPDQMLYFASDMPGGFGGTDIYVARWEKDRWGTPVNLGPEVNTKGNELFPFVDEKGSLYFSSDGHAGLGDLDIFFAPMSNDGLKAKTVINMGEPINSNKDDFGIVTDGERKLGYFSSNRRNGGADDDIYRFRREGSAFPCRELVVVVVDAQSKAPLANASLAVEDTDNASDKRELKTDAEGNVRICLDPDNEFRFLASSEGYQDNKIGFSSHSLQDDQPTRLEIPLAKPVPIEPVVAKNTLRGRVTTQLDKKPIAGVKVVLRNECDGTTQEVITGEDGSYSFETKAGCDYTLEAMKDNMGTMGSKINKEGVGTTDLVMFKKGDVIKVENIYYDLNKFNIRTDAAAELDKLVELMKKYPSMTIEMRSHTDSRSSAQYNKTLSSNRAKAAVAYLKSKGIKPTRLVAKGYGESLLVNKCKDGVNCPEEEHQQNRRTEIKILSLAEGAKK
ncbi:carboxypeptidase regulatory-like domain-containing protein [Rudanella lutea]|uniref:carboxypeptidase regulatory-like domain-containing protein n=1 Tax=Rudanella lutea TaxID=451374 RepID=UPI00035EEA2C|nr:carboxypeptidase regulatory-like domain-containing protein [Rudanella lutea]